MIENSDKNSNPALETATSEFTVASNKSALTYKKLSDSVFFWMAMFLHLLTLGLAMTIDDVTVVFEFAGAVGSSSITFLFPSVAYILALNKYGTTRQKAKCESIFFFSLAWIFLILYTALLGSFIYLESMKLLGHLPSDKELSEN